MTIIIKLNRQPIIKKQLTTNQLQQIQGDGAEWIINCFKIHLNLDISNYEISSIESLPNSTLTLNIKPEDLEKLRNDKITQILL